MAKRLGSKIHMSLAITYTDIFEFNKDVEMVWSNARKYNNPGSHIFMAAGYLARTWKRNFACIIKDYECETVGKWERRY